MHCGQEEVYRKTTAPTDPDPERTAKMLARVLAGGCVACGVSGMHAELHPVPEDHLTFFGGDELCRTCALAHGVL